MSVGDEPGEEFFFLDVARANVATGYEDVGGVRNVSFQPGAVALAYDVLLGSHDRHGHRMFATSNPHGAKDMA